MADLDEHLPGIIDGDSTAYAAWLAGAEPQLRLSLKRFAEQVDTEAVLQEALLRVWQVAPRFRPDGNPNALLRLGIRIARNVAISELRRRRNRSPSVELDPNDQRISTEELRAPDPMLRRVITKCRERLPPKPAAAFTARLSVVGRHDRDIAAELGMKINTFLQNFTRARKLLADCLTRSGVDLSLELN